MMSTISKQKKVRFTMSPEILQLAKRLSKERPTKKTAHRLLNPNVSRAVDAPPPAAEPLKLRSTFEMSQKHASSIPVLAITLNGWTLSYGTRSTSMRGVSNSMIAKEIIDKKIKVLYCDEESHRKCMDAIKSYKHLIKKIDVLKVETMPLPPCEVCKEKNCHRWVAAKYANALNPSIPIKVHKKH